MKLRVNEIFYSLQGEGYYTGKPSVFVRFSGCNLKCSFCDTQHESYTEMSEEEIVKQALTYPSRHIILTGGEPTLQITSHLTTLLHNAGFYIQIETNGTIKLNDGCEIDWITCSPKEGTQIKIERIDELKIVYIGQDLSPYENGQYKNMFLQPCSCSNTEQVIEYIERNPMWRLSLQTHKVLNIK